MYYHGRLINTWTIEIFRAEKMPTYEEYHNLYGAVYGGFYNRTEAINNVNWLYNNNVIIRNVDMRTKESKNNRNLFKLAGIV
jgi:hypothetical protein